MRLPGFAILLFTSNSTFAQGGNAECYSSCTQSRVFFVPKKPQTSKLAAGQNCVKRFGICVGSSSNSSQTDFYRGNYVDSQRRDRTIVSHAYSNKERDDRDDAKWTAITEASKEPNTSVLGVVSAAVKYSGWQSPGRVHYNQIMEQGYLKAEELEYDKQHPR